MTARGKIEQFVTDEEVLLLDEELYVDSLVGVVMLPGLRAVYDFDKMVEELVEKKGRPQIMSAITRFEGAVISVIKHRSSSILLNNGVIVCLRKKNWNRESTNRWTGKEKKLNP